MKLEEQLTERYSLCKNQYELENVLERLFEDEPVIADITSVLNIHNSIIEYLNKSIVFLNQKSYMEAENEIKLGFESFKKNRAPLHGSRKEIDERRF